MVVYFTDPIRCDRLCRHLLTSSLRLFSRSLLMRIWYFSSKQRLHLFEDPLYGLALSMMRHDKSYSSLFPFRCQICLLSSVAFFKLLFLNDCLTKDHVTAGRTTPALSRDVAWTKVSYTRLPSSPKTK